MRQVALHTLVISAGLSAGALAATQVIHQQGRAFSAESVTLKKGEALTFLNDDSVPHNIMSVSKGNEFNLGSQSPGTSVDVTFKEAGDYLIEVRDVMYRGGADFVYRLRIGDFPCATTPIPMAAKRGSNVSGIVGTGMGLYLAKMIVDMHGGRIEVQSKEDEGSRFTVRFPIKPRPQIQPSSATQAASDRCRWYSSVR